MARSIQAKTERKNQAGKLSADETGKFFKGLGDGIADHRPTAAQLRSSAPSARTAADDHRGRLEHSLGGSQAVQMAAHGALRKLERAAA